MNDSRGQNASQVRHRLVIKFKDIYCRRTIKNCILLLFVISSLSTSIHAHSDDDRFEVGFALGSVYPLASSDLKDFAKKGNNQNFWLGYGFDENWAVELGMDRFNFTQIETQHQAVTLSGVYRSTNEMYGMHAIVKLGFGIEADFKYVSIGGLVHYYFIANAGDPNYLKSVGALAPVLFITFYDAVDLANSSIQQK